MRNMIMGTMLATSFALAGCATVTTQSYNSVDVQKPWLNVASQALSENNPLDRTKAGYAEPGVIYYLPTKLLKSKVSIEIVDLAKKKKALAAAKDKASAAKTAKAAATAEVARLKAVVAELVKQGGAGGAPAVAQAHAEQTRLLAVAESNKQITTATADALATSADAIEAEVRALEAAPTNCLIKSSLSSGQTVGDTSLVLRANPKHQWFRDDVSKISVNPQGLLESANSVSTSRLLDAVAEFSGAIAARDSLRDGNDETEDPSCQVSLPFEIEFDPKNTAALNTLLRQRQIPVAYYVNTGLLGANAVDPNVVEPNKDYAGLFYRSETAVIIETHICKGLNACPTARNPKNLVGGARVMLPQYGAVGFVPMNASPFVQTVSDVKFANGSLKNLDTERPSELFEIVRLPVRLLITEPAKRIGEAVGLAESKSKLASETSNLLQTQTRGRIIEACIELANDADEPYEELSKCIEAAS